MMMINLSGDESVRDGTYKFTSRLDTIGGVWVILDTDGGFPFLIFLPFVWDLCVIYKILSLVSGRW